MNLPAIAEITPSGEMSRRDYIRVAEACTELNFAVVRNIIPDIEEVATEVEDFTKSADRDQGRRRSADITEGRFTRDFYLGNMEDTYPRITSTLDEVALGIASVAFGHRFRRTPKFARVNIGPVVTSDTTLVNTYLPGEYIDRHWDDVHGIAFVLNTQGIGEAELTDAWGNVLGTTDLSPADMLIMPAKVGEYGGPTQQVFHRIVNKTPLNDNDGIRRSLAAVYRNAEVTES